MNDANPDPLPPAAEPAAIRTEREAQADASIEAPIAVTGGAPDAPRRLLPADLRVPWAWRDLLWFLLFAVISNFVLGMLVELAAIALFHAPKPDISGDNVNPAVVIIAQALWFGATILYLRAVVRVRTAEPFWRSIGWRGLPGSEHGARAVALGFVGAGAVMAVVVSLLGQLRQDNGQLPIEKLFNSRLSVVLLMSLGILVAPLVEETIFRGFLYPLLARRFGVPVGVVVTGLLFGAMHGPQLWLAYTQIGLMMVVGVVLTWVRARTGTVTASYLMHLGYNSLLFLGFVIATGGLRHFTAGT